MIDFCLDYWQILYFQRQPRCQHLNYIIIIMSKKDKKSKRHRNSRSRSSSYSSRDRSSSRGKQKYYSKNQDKNNNSVSVSQQLWKSQAEQTKTLCIQAIDCQVQMIEQPLSQLSLQIGTSMPDQVQFRNNNAYIKYPSIEASSKTLEHLKGRILINNKMFKIDFYPSRKIDFNLVQDWFCDKCQYKNFARRNKCNRCDNPRNVNCKVVYNSAAIIRSNITSKYGRDEGSGNCSLMIRGPVVMQIQQEVLLDIFQKFAPIKDIRMIRNKNTGMNKDFAFVEFYSAEQTTMAFKAANTSEFKIRGQPVSVLYSKNRRQDKQYSLRYQQNTQSTIPKKPKELPDNYCKRERQRQIREQKQKPIITMEQLKQKKQAQLRKQALNATTKQLTAQKSRRRQAELQLKKWQKQMKVINQILYICPICVRKFKDEGQLTNHEQLSELHRQALKNIELAL